MSYSRSRSGVQAKAERRQAGTRRKTPAVGQPGLGRSDGGTGTGSPGELHVGHSPTGAEREELRICRDTDDTKIWPSYEDSAGCEGEGDEGHFPSPASLLR